MTLRARLARAALVAAVLLACAGGAVAGVRMGDAASAPDIEEIVIAAPDALAGPPTGTVRSAGGFTGFGGPPAIRGEVQRSGAIQSTQADAVTLGSTESSVTVRYTSPQRLFRIGPVTSALKVGDLVQVRVDGDRASAVLRLPPGLEQGGNRP